MTLKVLLHNPRLLSLVGVGVSAASGFLGVMVLARILTPGELGTWILYLAVWTFLDMLRSGLVHTALVRYYAASHDSRYTGAAWAISGAFTILVSVLLGGAGLMGLELSDEWRLVLPQLPWLLLATWPYSVALWQRQAENRFDHILRLRLGFTLPFLAFVALGFWYNWSLESIAWVQTLLYLLVSLGAVAAGWTHWQALRTFKMQQVRELWSFGRYTIGTLLCTNLLKSSDTFLIGYYLSSAVVAAYNLPYKLIEIVEIPLRSVMATLLPQLSQLQYGDRKSMEQAKALFFKELKLLTLVLVPVSVLCFFLAEPLVVLLGGEAYRESAILLQVFAVYSLLLPADRLIGVTLDSLGRPRFNTIKVVLMAVFNIIGDIVVLHVWADPVPVAVVTIGTVVLGVVFGGVVLRSVFDSEVSGAEAESKVLSAAS
ncbi:oligosaccharide flippase family protein [Telluribacter sp. SYSU D00476]|uniref:oligosaccharide flippase family protein n=1 Tax=Telluribacter sp. SYSU D00476 TaxID=2811430 RepID=UPI001FF4B553|nr:oligosaccharide flippase family protein [Telluribacter sp. SYSU D00476]